VFFAMLAKGAESAFFLAKFGFNVLVKFAHEVFISVGYRIRSGAAQVRDTHQMSGDVFHEP